MPTRPFGRDALPNLLELNYGLKGCHCMTIAESSCRTTTSKSRNTRRSSSVCEDKPIGAPPEVDEDGRAPHALRFVADFGHYILEETVWMSGAQTPPAKPYVHHAGRLPAHMLNLPPMSRRHREARRRNIWPALKVHFGKIDLANPRL